MQLKTLILFCLLITACNNNVIEDKILEANAAYKIKNYDRAIELSQKILNEYPNNAAAHANLGASYWQKGQLEDSEKHATLALELDAKNCEALFQLAVLAEHKEQLGEAISYHEKILAIDSNYQKSYPVVSNLYASSGNKTLALKYGKKALENNPNNLDLLNNMGFVYLELEDYINALRCFDKVILQDSTFAYAYNNKGYIFLKQGDCASAIEAIEQSLLLDHNNAYAYRNLAVCYAKQGDLKACCDALKVAQKAKFGLRLQQELEELASKCCH